VGQYVNNKTKIHFLKIMSQIKKAKITAPQIVSNQKILKG
jgi:hypothetical protein